MQLDVIKELVEYRPDTGEFYKKATGRPMKVNTDTLSVTLYNPSTKEKFIIKAAKLAWLLGTGKFPSQNKRILHRNLDKSDFRLQNLCVLSRETYRAITEASRNLSGALRLLPHPEDQYSYVIEYHQGGQHYTKVIEDIVTARKFFMKLQLKSAKILSKYCVFD